MALFCFSFCSQATRLLGLGPQKAVLLDDKTKILSKSQNSVDLQQVSGVLVFVMWCGAYLSKWTDLYEHLWTLRETCPKFWTIYRAWARWYLFLWICGSRASMGFITFELESSFHCILRLYSEFRSHCGTFSLYRKR